MANAAEIASLITQGMKPPQGNQDVSYHQGVVKSWDPVSGVNTVEVNGVILSNLSSIQNGMGVSYLPGDVVQVQRVQTKYSITGRASAPNGLTGSSPISLTGSSTYLNLKGSTTGAWFPLASSPQVQVRIGNAALVMFGAARVTCRNALLIIGLNMVGPSTLSQPGFNGSSTAVGMNNGGANGPILDFSMDKQLMFYKGTTWSDNGVPQTFQPGVYTFNLYYNLTTFTTDSTILDVGVFSPWITVLPF